MLTQTRSAFVAIVGRPNVGKSSLLNILVGEKVAIVSDKPQTTRTRITGVITKGETQYVFFDTPGMHKPKTKLSEHMVGTVRDTFTDVDLTLLMVDATRPLSHIEEDLIASLKAANMPVVLVINKIDLLADKSALMKLIAQYNELAAFDAVIPVSVIQGDGISLIWPEIDKFTVEGPHFFPQDMMTDQPERVVAAEMLREQMLRLLSQEIPHGIAVVIERMHEREDKPIVDIEAIIYCERASHKGIIIGKQGSMLKQIASSARNEMEHFFGVKVNLQCWVKIKEDWRNKEGLIRNFGLS